MDTLFGETPKLPTYTFAFVLLPKSVYTQLAPARTRPGIPITLHFNPRVIPRSLAAKLLEYGQFALNELSAYFGQNPIPDLRKVDLVIIPEFFLQGMENFGLVTLNEGYLRRTLPALRLSLIAHELGSYVAIQLRHDS